MVLAIEFEEQIKFDVSDSSAFDAIKNNEKILSYKSNHSGEYIYEDYYYDTPDFALYRQGWSYRFRVRNKEGAMEYGVQFIEIIKKFTLFACTIYASSMYLLPPPPTI